MFEVISRDEDTRARVGRLKLGGSVLETPAFLPVATKADVKMTSPPELEQMGVQGVITNAFVLYLRPGVEVIEAAGGVKGFMGWDGMVFTDSGGFQLLNPDFVLKISDDHVTFKSPFDGTRHDITPESCWDIQAGLGTDVAMVLDDCPRFGSDHGTVAASAKRTINWAERFKKVHDPEASNVFGIVQGGTFHDLREKCTRALIPLDFDGYAIGGLCIGEPKEVMHEIVGMSAPLLPEGKPRYLMGVGSPEDMLRAIAQGVDIFDSVFPTRNARHSTVYTRNGKINLGKDRYSRDLGPIDEGCRCHTCSHFSLAYVNHLLREHEFLGMRLATIHNLHFLMELMRAAGEAIDEGRFAAFKTTFMESYLG